MSEFLLTAEEPLEAATKTTHLASSGLAPTADVPTTKGKETPPCYAPCEACGTPVLTGIMATGVRLAVDPQWPTYVVQWHAGEAAPRLSESRGYPVHRCLRREHV